MTKMNFAAALIILMWVHLFWSAIFEIVVGHYRHSTAPPITAKDSVILRDMMGSGKPRIDYFEYGNDGCAQDSSQVPWGVIYDTRPDSCYEIQYKNEIVAVLKLKDSAWKILDSEAVRRVVVLAYRLRRKQLEDSL